MYDFSSSEELRSFFNINPELETSQKFVLHNREEVTSFETMLNKHVETETHLPFRSLNLTRAFEYCMSLKEDGPKLFAALLRGVRDPDACGSGTCPLTLKTE